MGAWQGVGLGGMKWSALVMLTTERPLWGGASEGVIDDVECCGPILLCVGVKGAPGGAVRS